MGGNVPALVARLVEVDAHRQSVVQQLEGEGALQVIRIDWRTTERAARARLADWRALLTRQAGQGRHLLRMLLPEPIRFTLWEDSGRRGYRFAGVASLSGLFEGTVEVTKLASPRGFERGSSGSEPLRQRTRKFDRSNLSKPELNPLETSGFSRVSHRVLNRSMSRHAGAPRAARDRPERQP